MDKAFLAQMVAGLGHLLRLPGHGPSSSPGRSLRKEDGVRVQFRSAQGNADRVLVACQILMSLLF